MPNANLQTWLNLDDRELVDAIKGEVRAHIAEVQSTSGKFYGYAMLPGESYSVGNLVAAFNRESDLKPDKAAETYYRYSVDEWRNYEHGRFPRSDKLIETRNSQFEELHVKDDPEDYSMDGFEIAHVAKLHGTILIALAELRTDGLFGGDDSFVAIWIPDSGHQIMYQSAKALNSVAVYETFVKEFD